jgi:hypothetical protein
LPQQQERDAVAGCATVCVQYQGGGNLIDMGISTASVFLSTEVGELASKYQVWHKQMAEQNSRSSRPVSMLTKGSA